MRVEQVLVMGEERMSAWRGRFLRPLEAGRFGWAKMIMAKSAEDLVTFSPSTGGTMHIQALVCHLRTPNHRFQAKMDNELPWQGMNRRVLGKACIT